MKKITEKLLYLWFLLIVFEAPLRFFYFKLGLPSLVYFKDFLLIIIFVYFVIYTLSTLRINKFMLAIIAVIIYGVVVGLINQLSLLQVLFGLKIWLSFFVGFIALYTLDSKEKFFLNLFRIYVPIILVGIFLDLFFELPWSGFEYETFGHAIEGSRSWTTFGLSRIAGFGRSSFASAILLFCLSALYLTLRSLSSKKEKFSWKIYDNLLLVLSFAGIVITTSKTSILSFLILVLFYVLIKFYTTFKNIFRWITLIFVKFLLGLIFLYGFIPPIVSLVSPKAITNYLSSGDILMKAIFLSYIDRMEVVWPNAIQLLSKPYMIITGRGLGGIGAAQQYFEPGLYNPADNIYIYLLVDFGVVVLSLIIIYLLKKMLFLKFADKKNIFFYIFCLILFLYGATINVIESSILMITLGFLSALWNQKNAYSN